MKITAPNQIHVTVVLATAAISRLFPILYFHTDAGDTPTYELFATNILRGCGLSFSDPGSIDCVLNAGGYFPGYPAFMALIWMLFGKSNFPILISQLGFYLLALYWLLTALMRLTNSTKAVLGVGMLLALSPLQVGWFRFVITEPLAIAAATWFLAELVISIADRKLRKYHLALALSTSVYIRPDTILMVSGVFLVSFYIYDFKNSIKQLMIVVFLTSIPVSGWLIRNMMIGHIPLSMTSETAPKALGYHFWLNTWIVNEYERADASFPVWRAEYSKIKLHGSKYITTDELMKAQQLLDDPSLLDGQKFPRGIDQQFHELATRKVSARSKFLQIQIYFERVFWLLLNPFSSWGLPLEIRAIDKGAVVTAINKMDLVTIDSLLSDHKAVILGKITSFTYRVLMFATFLFLAVVTVFRPIFKHLSGVSFEMRVIVLATTLVVIIRLIFFVSIGGLESRYLVEVVPWVEYCCALWFAARLHRVMPIAQKHG